MDQDFETATRGLVNALNEKDPGPIRPEEFAPRPSLTMFILVGVPGSGKSTWVTEFTKDMDPNEVCVASADHFCLDEQGVYHWSPERMGYTHRCCQDKARAACESGVPTVIIDNTNIRARDRKVYLEMAELYGYSATMVVFPFPPSMRSIHNVPEATVRKMQAQLDSQGLEPGEHIILRGKG